MVDPRASVASFHSLQAQGYSLHKPPRHYGARCPNLPKRLLYIYLLVSSPLQNITFGKKKKPAACMVVVDDEYTVISSSVVALGIL
ncbi:hypothetical protein NC652_035049 [Populus alba x Populus x berolinensis]|uniref:Uncharacterized protein n=1 Tax=Populus alba x Populus x berolinensis TaxID=444605 RepID=A0AAD6LRN8_9ROSI|nr:hypothetical protein NC652_035049 [Populus alba x Populus x berolinensis]KAJ6970532.1 hypothetical protein NC653_034966 [Populus alba x Populus x berolinensis]